MMRSIFKWRTALSGGGAFASLFSFRKISGARAAVVLSLSALLVVGAGVAFADEPIQLTECGEISAPGAYELANSVYAEAGSCFHITASGVSLDGNGFTIDGDEDSSYLGVHASDVNNLTLTGLNITDFGDAIRVASSTGLSISNATISGQSVYGFRLTNTPGASVTDNAFSGVGDIALYVNGDSTGSVLTGNDFSSSNGGIQVYACFISDGEDCEGRSTGVTVDGNEFSSISWSGIVVSGVESSDFTDNTFNEVGYGVMLDWRSSGNEVSGNVFTDVGVGVQIEDFSEENLVTENEITGASTGVYIEDASHGNTISYNEITNASSGFFIDGSDDNIVEYNTITLSTTNYGDGSSSPLVFTWNGEGYDYIADVGRGIPRNTVGTDYARIPADSLAEDDGVYSMRIAQEYNEIVYYDALALLTFDHEPGYDVVTSLQRNKEGEFFTIADEPSNPLVSCVDMYENDCLEQLRESGDDQWSFRDDSNLNSWELDFGDLSGAERILLVIEAARDYSLESASLRQIQVKNAEGEWVDAYSGSSISSPGGTPRRQVIDLTGKFLTDDYRVRFGYDRTRVDYVAIDTSEPVSYELSTNEAESVELGFHGYTAVDKTYFWDHDYSRVNPVPPQQYLPQTGLFTRYGDVTPLLDEVDDQFVIMHHGDQMSVSFDYEAPAPGTERSFILYNWATFKHADMGEAGLTVEPLPFEGMTRYPYVAPQAYPMTEENELYLAKWNTREIDRHFGMALPASVNTIVRFNTISSETGNPENPYGGEMGIYVYDEESSSITDNEISGFYTGITVEDSVDITVLRNEIHDTLSRGIDVNNVVGLAIEENDIRGVADGRGIDINDASDLSVVGNTIADVEFTGVEISSAFDARVTGNVIDGAGGSGIEVDGVRDYLIEENTVSCDAAGLYVTEDYSGGGEGVETFFPGAHSGDHVWEAGYDDNQTTQLSRAFDLSAAGESASLTFWIWYETESCCDALDVYVDDGEGTDNPLEFRGDGGVWAQQEIDLTSYIGNGELTVSFSFDTDGSVIRSGVFLDDFSLQIDGETVWEDNVESGAGAWSVQTESSPAWSIASHTPEEEAEGAITGQTLTGNTVNAGEVGLYIYGVSSVSATRNTFQAPLWVSSEGVEDVALSDEDVGNSYFFENGDPASSVYEIFDADGNGYADSGDALPFGIATLAEGLWIGDLTDAHPGTDVRARTGRRPSGHRSRGVSSRSDEGAASSSSGGKSSDEDAPKPSSSKPASAPRFGRDLETGSTGDDVRDLQKFLNANGYVIAQEGPGSPGQETDRFGAFTREALARFQAANGIVPASGYFGPKTRALIESLGGVPAAAEPAETSAPATQPSSVRNLQSGDSGDDVRSLQELLIARASGPAAAALAANGASGYFGELTRAALAEMQASLGVSPAAGYFGPATRAAMSAAGISGLWW